MLKKRVLIISQENYIGELLRAELMEEGYEATLADSGEKAFIKYKQEFPDLVLVDTVLSDIDSGEVLRTFREGNASPPVVVWSAYDFNNDENLWWVSEAYIMKTASFFKIKKKIKELCPCH
ncbi:MAG: response regulator [Candidatus Manganitrophaceae bacterium]|nr:MAG: response regulator [Candidatus Manganitrophaceae bacterium]